MNIGVGVLLLSGVVCFLLGVGAGMSSTTAPPPCPEPTTLECFGEPTRSERRSLHDECRLTSAGMYDCTPPSVWECPVVLAPDVPLGW